MNLTRRTRNMKNIYLQMLESKNEGSLPTNLDSTMCRFINLPFCDEYGSPFLPEVIIPPPEDISEGVIGASEYKKIMELRRKAKRDIIKYMQKFLKAHGYSLQEHDCYSKHSYGKYRSKSIKHTISFRNIYDEFEIHLLYTIMIDLEIIKNACVSEFHDELDAVSKVIITSNNSTTHYNCPNCFSRSLLLNSSDEFNHIVTQVDYYLNNVAFPLFDIIKDIHDVAELFNAFDEFEYGDGFFGDRYISPLLIAYYDIIEHRYPQASENFRKCYSEQKNKIARIDERIQHPTFQYMVDKLEADRQDEYLTLRFYEILMNINNYKTE